MKKAFWLAVSLGLVFSCTPKDPEKVVKLVDSRIYYPQSQGLSSLSCKLSSPYIYEMFAKIAQNRPGSEQIFEDVKINVTYYWSSGYGSKFIVEGLPDYLPSLKEPISMVFLGPSGEQGQGVEIFIIPQTEKDQLAPFKLSLKKEKGKLTVVGTSPDPDAGFRQYDLVVDPKNWLILERVYYFKQGVSYFTPKFEIRNNKRYLVRMDGLLDQGEEKFRFLAEMDYQDLQGFWLVKNLTYGFTKADTGEKVIGPVQIDFDNCKINPFISPQIFKGGRIEFLEVKPEGPAIIKPGKTAEPTAEKPGSTPSKHAPTPAKPNPMPFRKK